MTETWQRNCNWVGILNAWRSRKIPQQMAHKEDCRMAHQVYASMSLHWCIQFPVGPSTLCSTPQPPFLVGFNSYAILDANAALAECVLWMLLCSDSTKGQLNDNQLGICRSILDAMRQVFSVESLLDKGHLQLHSGHVGAPAQSEMTQQKACRGCGGREYHATGQKLSFLTRRASQTP